MRCAHAACGWQRKCAWRDGAARDAKPQEECAGGARCTDMFVTELTFHELSGCKWCGPRLVEQSEDVMYG